MMCKRLCAGCPMLSPEKVTPLSWIMLAVALGMLFGSAGCEPSQESAPQHGSDAAPRRVIWVVVDSLRADHLGYAGYGRDTSPWLDELAEQSVVFERAIAPSNVTRRSVGAYMSGMPYSLLHTDPDADGLPRAATSVAEAFQAAGFRTVGCTTNYFLRPEEGHNQGFDEYHTLYAQSQPYGTFGEIVRQFKEAYEPSGGREFIYVHTMDVHHPYTPPIPYAWEFTTDYDRDVVHFGNIYTHSGKPVVGNLPYYAENNIPLTEADLAQLIGLYDGTIRYTDAMLPKLLASLGYDPAADMLVITSDHGEQFFERGFWRHGASLMPEEIVVPLLIRFDGFPARRLTQPVSLLDIFPTFCEIFGLERPEGLTGKSVLPLLRGEAMAPHDVYTETPDGTGPAAGIVGDDMLYWIYADTHFLRPQAAWPFAEGLFDLAADPGCQKNLVDIEPDSAARYNERLRALNPRWASFTRDVLDAPAQIARGPNMFTTDWPPPVSAPAAGVRGADEGAVTVALPEARASVSASLEKAGTPHLLTLRYQLKSGVVDVAFVDTEQQETLWSYVLRKPTNGWATVTRRVTPPGKTVSLTMSLREPGVFTLDAPSLHALDVPQIALPSVGAYELDSAPDREWTAEEAARLEALGYLDGD
ncbi:MAG: sulfatase-like hydrolase/transferase [Candidatus Hydrogenedentota bacterium]